MDRKGQLGIILGWIVTIIFEGIIIGVVEMYNYSIVVNLVLHIGLPVIFVFADLMTFIYLI